MQNTPQIVVAREAGACYGVNRALDLVREAAEGSAAAMRGFYFYEKDAEAMAANAE